MDRVSEPAREGFLYQLWLERDFSKSAVHTADGREVYILEKGVRNRDAGPDFLGALIRLQGQIIRGDVEVHPVAGDWYNHGHQNDPRYNSVILHVVTMYCPRDFSALRQDGTSVPTLNLDSVLEKPAELMEQDQEEVPFQRAPQCRLIEEPEEFRWRLLEQAAQGRLRLMSNQMTELRSAESWDQIIYHSLFNALGFAKNQIPFRRLAQMLPVETIWRYIWNDPPVLAQEKVEAWLFGAAGLLPPNFHSADRHMQKYWQRLHQLWIDFPERRKLDPLKPEAWQFFRLRPANFPTRRIAAAAVLTVRFMEKGFFPALIAPLSNSGKKPGNRGREWLKAFTVDHHPFWSHYYHFASTLAGPGPIETKLLGDERAHDIVLNLVVPGLLAYGEEIEDGRLINQVRMAFQEYSPVCDNEITRLMQGMVFGATGNKTIVNRAWQQQGLLHLAKTLCQAGDCRRCIVELAPQAGHPFY